MKTLHQVAEAQVNARYKQMKKEEREREDREMKRQKLLDYIQRKKAFYERFPKLNPFYVAREVEQNDEDYQFDVDTELSLTNVDITKPNI